VATPGADSAPKEATPEPVARKRSRRRISDNTIPVIPEVATPMDMSMLPQETAPEPAGRKRGRDPVEGPTRKRSLAAPEFGTYVQQHPIYPNSELS